MTIEKQYEYVLPVGYVLKGGASDYVIEKVLGKGGFGITYKVKGRILYQNIHVDVHFAVKEYFPDNCWRDSDKTTLLAPPTKQQEIYDGLQDFINEGQRLQQVCKLNPNIVNVNEVFEANGTAYYVLEYLEGGSLTEKVRNSAAKCLTEEQMIEVMMPVGRAVQCLHDNHMLHLDIKPDNIVMRRDDSDGTEEPVLIDFGIAVHFGGDGTPTSKTPSLGISPGFSPIEQYTQVKNFDPRFDVYAFSATCLYLLTGKAPVEALNIPTGFVRSVIPSNVSERVAAAIECGMSKEKSQRTASISELLESFKPISHSVPPEPAVTPPSVVPPPVTLEQEYMEEEPDNGYVYDEELEDGGKKKMLWTIIGALLGLALLAGIVFWAVKGCSSGNDKSKSDAEDASVEEVNSNVGGYYDETDDNYTADTSSMTISTENLVDEKAEDKAPSKDVVQNQQPNDNKRAKDNNDNSSTETYNKDQSSAAQPSTTNKQPSKTDNEVYKSAAQPPQFPGGTSGLMNFLSQNIQYPQTAQDNGIQGKVVVQFVVEKNGKVGEVVVVRGVDKDLDKEAVRLCKMLPSFTPGRNSNGDPIRVWYTLPVTFKLQGAK
ncbi:MAG: TonB family protein [Muribaculaceae bacterium]|nr:TonB family protein [Muribaculaceae bacterium]